jgi:hypothetical protein
VKVLIGEIDPPLSHAKGKRNLSLADTDIGEDITPPMLESIRGLDHPLHREPIIRLSGLDLDGGEGLGHFLWEEVGLGQGRQVLQIEPAFRFDLKG